MPTVPGSIERALVSRPDWSVPVSESAVAEMLAENTASRIQFSRNKEGKNCLLLFSSGDAYNVYGAVRLVRDYYGKEQFGRLREMAGAILLEETLMNLRKGAAQDGSRHKGAGGGGGVHGGRRVR